MEPYLNLFYSFQRGNRDSLESNKRLEDNLTRAFLVTLKNLKDKKSSFLEKLLGINSPKKIHLATQNINSSELLKKIKESPNKKILLIGGKPIDIDALRRNIKPYKSTIREFEKTEGTKERKKEKDRRP